MQENNQKKRITRQQLQNRKVKQWSSIWWKGIIIWIWIFFLILLLIIFFFFFYLTNNPNVWKWIWMWASTIQSITSVFAGLLFWWLFIFFLVLWLTYIYKLLTKSIWKFKNIIWTIIVFILWITNLVFWWIVFSKIANIETNDIIDSQDVLIWQINFMNKKNFWDIEYTPLYENNFPLIAPISISFQLNENVFNNTYYNNLQVNEWAIDPVRFELDCGNWQVINYTSFSFPINRYCLYLNKWEYNIDFKFIYNTNNDNNKELNLPSKVINIASEVEFNTTTNLNPNKNEIIIWERTDEVQVDLRKIPSDLWLVENDIDIDFEGNNNFKTLKWIAKHSYNEDWLYYISLKLPNKDNYPYYTFPVRVNPSTKPTCIINSKENKWIYTFSVDWDSPKWNIKEYNYEIKNITTSNIIDKGNWKIIRKSLENGSDYEVIWEIIDTQWNIWSCNSNIIKLSSKKSYNYNIKIYDKNNNEIKYENNELIVNIIPTHITLKIEDIIWWEEDITDIGFDTDNDGNIDKKTREINIEIKKDKTINTIIKDIYWNTSVKTLNIIVEQKEVIAKLTSNKYKWEAPLKINFDASTSEVTSQNDDITYFQWDFWDGEVLENTRRWTVVHTFKTPWDYNVKVKVETEKWFEDVAEKKVFVYKPVNTASVVFPNNLWWQMKAWNSLNIELQTSWAIKSIEWDFWDGDTFSCSWRECMNITHTYNKKWFYKIQAKIEYDDGSPSTSAVSSINIIE